ncbi:hypothetical protein FXF53_24295 [Micromonospora sp. WP24]|uniref:hypothetical protein n=1 Tax=Micromonospora sp. WP24 TaxID=2604469 RepID=UPI0011D806B8|nr:hypothetical protein [Micromonospora sp. WP24]TYB95452.1 hypothetical protein FXF53_24295 [Micromonospora sp. WP24]
MGGTLKLKDSHDDAVVVVRQLLADPDLPAECEWAGFQWDDGRVWYRVTIVAWSPGEVVKVVIGCAQQRATFGVPNGPAPTVSRYLNLSETQRSRSWSVYRGDPDRDRDVWIHLAQTVRRVRHAFDVRELHREHDGTFGLLMVRPDSA